MTSGVQCNNIFLFTIVPSEAVGIQDPSVIKDDQITASHYIARSPFGPQNARLYNANKWRTLIRDTSPWLQVKLNDVTTITKIAVQGSGANTVWVKTFKLSFSMDGIYWTSYKGNFTEKVR